MFYGIVHFKLHDACGSQSYVKNANASMQMFRTKVMLVSATNYLINTIHFYEVKHGVCNI